MAGTVLYFVVIVLVGLVLTSAIGGKGSGGPGRTAGSWAALGAGAMGFLLLCLSLLGRAPDRTAVVVVGVLAASALVWLWRRGRFVPEELRPRRLSGADRWALVPAAGVAGVVVLTAWTATGNPLTDWDAVAIWATKARLLLGQPLSPRPEYFVDLSRSYSHLDYPLLFPFLTAGSYAMAGGAVEAAGQLLCPFFLAALASILYDGMRDFLPRLPSMLLTFLVLLLPGTMVWAPSGQATLPLLVFYAGSVVALLRWTRTGERSDLIRLALFSVFLALTKNEGFALAAIHGGVAIGISIVRRQLPRLRDACVGAALSVLLLLPWILWNHSTPRSHEDYGGRLNPATILEHGDRLRPVLSHLGRSVTDLHAFGWFWYLVAIAAILGHRGWRRADVRVLWFVWAAHLAVYAAALMVTPWNLEELLGLVAARLVLHTVPAAALLVAAHWSATRRGEHHP